MKKNNETGQYPIEQQVNNEYNREKILEMPPSELVEYFASLEEKGVLENFLEKALLDAELLAQVSYWEKWFKKDHINLIENIVKKKKEIYPGDTESLPVELDKKFNPQELEVIFSNLGSIQLTYGCSKGCVFCGFDALPGVREHIPYAQLANLFQKYGKNIKKNKPILYWASETSDYVSDDKTYQDVDQLAVEYAGYSPDITSRETKSDEWLEFLGTKKNVRVSLYNHTSDIVKNKTELIPKSVKTVGENKKHTKGIGKSFTKEFVGERGIGCFDGVMLSPRGLYNVVQVPISLEYPQGQIIVPIEKNGDADIKKGDTLTEVLSKSIVDYNYNNVYYNLFKKPHLTVFVNGEYYDITFDKDKRVKGVEKSKREQISELVDKKLNLIQNEFMQIMILADVKLRFKIFPSVSAILDDIGRLTEENKELTLKGLARYFNSYQEFVEKIKKSFPDIDDYTIKTYMELEKFIENEYRKNQLKIKDIVYKQLEKLGKEGVFSLAWDLNSISKKIFGPVCFKMEQDKKSKKGLLVSSLSVKLLINEEIVQDVNIRFVSEPSDKIDDIIFRYHDYFGYTKKYKLKDLQKIFTENDLKFRLEIGG